MYEFKLLSQRGCLVLETFSVSHGKAYPYLPLIDLLKHYFQLTTHDDERRRREKITGKVLTLDRGLEDTLPYLFFLLGLAGPTSPLQQMDGQIRRQRILEVIKRLLLRESLNQPLILIFEDLHWLDNETQAFLQVLSESVATAKLLLLVNYRPEYQQDWSGKTYFSQLRLDPLGQEQAEEMLTALLGDTKSPLPRWERPVLSKVEGDRERVKAEDLHVLKRFILDKTEGNPFFMEEIVQALAEQGQEEGIVQMRQGLAAYRTTGAEEMQSYFLALLAEACERVGQREEGLSVLAEALAHVDKTGERFQEAELYRLKGKLTLQSQTSPKQVPNKSQASQDRSEDPSTQHLTPSTPAEAEAEAWFLKAIEIARKQQAKSLELRAVMSLSRLWQQQGKKKQAHEMLAEIYGWFTEGFDTADLKEARALLNDLS